MVTRRSFLSAVLGTVSGAVAAAAAPKLVAVTDVSRGVPGLTSNARTIYVESEKLYRVLYDAQVYGIGTLQVDPAITKARWIKNAHLYAGGEAEGK